jgi:hypothetical protein
MSKSRRLTFAEKREIFYFSFGFSIAVIAALAVGIAFGWVAFDIIYHLITH